MKKLILTESDKEQIRLHNEKLIIENFSKTFNKIKRLDENDINDGSRPNYSGMDIKKPKLIDVSRVTGGMTPRMRFGFDDGETIQTKSDGYGLSDREDAIYGSQISKWFQTGEIDREQGDAKLTNVSNRYDGSNDVNDSGLGKWYGPNEKRSNLPDDY